MSRILTIALALSGSAILGAQAPPPSPPAAPAPAPQVQQSAPPATQKPATVTFSGCLKPGASAGSFILADAAAVPAATSADASKAEPQARGTTGSAKSYNLMPGKTGEDLGKHVNQKIEVTGTVSAAAPSASAPATPPAGGASQPTETVNMQSFKMVSATCP
jgi:hypothetical protein